MREKGRHAAREADLRQQLSQLVKERETWQSERDRLQDQAVAAEMMLAQEKEYRKVESASWVEKETLWKSKEAIRLQQDALEEEYRTRRDELQLRLQDVQRTAITTGPRPVIHHPTLLIRTIPPTLSAPEKDDPTSWTNLLHELRGVQFDPTEFVAAHCAYISKTMDIEVPCDSSTGVTYPYCLRHTLYHCGLFVWKSRIDGAGWGLFAGMYEQSMAWKHTFSL